jgi:GrpB-like predicted nucleotidyltransferase (UPF0157 family)
VERPEPPPAINDVIVQIHASGFVPTEMAWPALVTRAAKRENRSVLLPDPNDISAYEELEKRTIGGPRPLSGRIDLRDYDPSWPNRYDEHASRIRVAIGDRAVRIEHVGSTSVPGLVAKPIIDIVLEVPDSAEEAAYVGELESACYVLRMREPDWFEHRLFHTPGRDVNLHVFSAGCAESERMVRFRDWLRVNAADRDLYVRTKRELAVRDWKYMQQYADAKTSVVEQIMTRAMATSTYPGGPLGVRCVR